MVPADPRAMLTPMSNTYKGFPKGDSGVDHGHFYADSQAEVASKAAATFDKYSDATDIRFVKRVEVYVRDGEFFSNGSYKPRWIYERTIERT